MCLATDACLTAYPGVASHESILAWYHTFVEVDHETIFTAISPSAESRNVVVSYKRTYVYEVLVNRFVKLAQENVWLGEQYVPT